MGKKDISQEQTFFPCRYRRNQSNQTNFVFLPFFIDLLGNLQVFAEIIKIKNQPPETPGFTPDSPDTMSGISGRSSGVSGTPNPEIPDLYPEFPGKPR